jgi:putative transposase
MQKAHKIRLNPAPDQVQAFMRAAGVARFAWNWALTEYKRLKEAQEPVDWNEIKKKFRALIDAEFPFVREVTKCAAEEAIADLRRSINTYYKAKKSHPKRKRRFPKLRKRSKKIGGFGLANDKFSLDNHEARLPKIGAVNMAESLRFTGKIVSGRVTERAGHWYLTVVVEVATAPTEVPAASVGIDFGLSRFATLSTGEVSETQARFRKSQVKLKRLQRGLSRKKKGSQNRRKWKRRVARHHERVANQRSDSLHKFTSGLVKAFGTICVEDLCLAGLCRTRLAKSFHDAGIGEAIRQLEYKQEWRGGELVKVGRFFPSSKRCHVCGTVNADLTLADRRWVCASCGTLHDRDFNAAMNLHLEGVALSRLGNGYVETLSSPVELAANTCAGNGAGKLRAVKQEWMGAAHVCTPGK